MEHARTVILSDLHLGRPKLSAHSARALRPLWQGATHLIINGDTAEVHHPVWWADAARQVLSLRDLTEADGTELTLLAGNHDAYLTERRHMLLADDAVFITHGDVLHPAVAPWSIRADHMRKVHENEICRWRNGGADHRSLEARLEAARVAGHAEWINMEEQASHASLRSALARPWSILQVFWYWRRVTDLADRFAAAHVPQSKFVIFGHTHRPGIWNRSDRTILNTGSFGFPGKPYGVIIENNELRFVPIILDGDVWRFANASALLTLPPTVQRAPGDAQSDDMPAAA